MLDKGIADRYAKALMSLCASREELDVFDDQLDAIVELNRRDPSLHLFLSHPKVETEKKKNLVRNVFGDRISTHVLNLILLMIDKKRGLLVLETARRFSQLADEMRGVEKGLVTTAVPLTDDLFKRLQDEIQKHSLHTIILERHVDPALIGGAIVKLGNLVFDGSVRHRLGKFRSEMMKVNVLGN
jgi:F-type H+-transporting ATPase subunit delta